MERKNNCAMDNGIKDKDQSIFEFYETLQREYIVCELRKKIYPRDKDKRYFERTSRFKKSKIEDISQRNQLPSIFNSDQVRNEINQSIFGDLGLPKFSYRNEDERNELECKDKYYYYRSGVEVRVILEDGSLKIGIIESGIDGEWTYVDGHEFKQLVIKDTGIIKVKFRGESEAKPVLTSRVSRII